MKWLRTIVLFDRGNVLKTADWKSIHESFVRAIESIDFPEGSSSLTLRRKHKRPDGQWERNGVVYLKNRFVDHMIRVENWQPEQQVGLGRVRTPPNLRLYPSLEKHQEEITSEFGGFDLVTTASNGTRVAIEWETGNISSSHRSMNKLAIALGGQTISAGVLIVPSRDLYEHLTDRVGNIKELSGYLTLWKEYEEKVKKGLLAICVVEHDFLTTDPHHPYLPSGKDGRSGEGKAKRR